MALFLAEKHFKVVFFFFDEAHAHATLGIPTIKYYRT